MSVFSQIVAGAQQDRRQNSEDIQNIIGNFGTALRNVKQRRQDQQFELDVAEEKMQSLSKRGDIDPARLEEFVSLVGKGKGREAAGLASSIEAALNMTSKMESDRLAQENVAAETGNLQSITDTRNVGLPQHQRTADAATRFDQGLQSALQTFSAGGNVDEETRAIGESFVSQLPEEDRDNIMLAATQGVPSDVIFQNIMNKYGAVSDPVAQAKQSEAAFKAQEAEAQVNLVNTKVKQAQLEYDNSKSPEAKESARLKLAQAEADLAKTQAQTKELNEKNASAGKPDRALVIDDFLDDNGKGYTFTNLTGDGPAVSPTQKEAQEMREAVSGLASSEKPIERLLEISDKFAKGFTPGAPLQPFNKNIAALKAEARSLRAQIGASLRASILGPGTVTEDEYQRLMDLIPDPEDVFTFPETKQAKMEALLSTARSNVKNRGRSIGIDVKRVDGKENGRANSQAKNIPDSSQLQPADLKPGVEFYDKGQLLKVTEDGTRVRFPDGRTAPIL